MLTLMLMLATPAYTVPPGLAVVAGLQGCWRVSGQVQGKDSPSIARGEWHLGRRYTLHLRATGSDPYEAAITYGAGEQPRAIGSVFLDTFGGSDEPSLGLGELEQGGFVQRYRFSDATYLDPFSRSGTGWRWTINADLPTIAAAFDLNVEELTFSNYVNIASGWLKRDLVDVSDPAA